MLFRKYTTIDLFILLSMDMSVVAGILLLWTVLWAFLYIPLGYMYKCLWLLLKINQSQSMWLSSFKVQNLSLLRKDSTMISPFPKRRKHSLYTIYLTINKYHLLLLVILSYKSISFLEQDFCWFLLFSIHSSFSWYLYPKFSFGEITSLPLQFMCLSRVPLVVLEVEHASQA